MLATTKNLCGLHGEYHGNHGLSRNTKQDMSWIIWGHLQATGDAYEHNKTITNCSGWKGYQPPVKTTEMTSKCTGETWTLESFTAIKPLSEILRGLQSTRGFLWLLGVYCEQLEKLSTMWTTQDNLVSLSTGEEYPKLVSGTQLSSGTWNPKRIVPE